MRQGFIKAGAVTPKIQVANPVYNGNLIQEWMQKAAEEKSKIVVFPELCITGYTCEDLFFQEALLQSAREQLTAIAAKSADYDAIFFVGLPWELKGKLYNMAAAVSGGKVLGMVPKSFIPNYNEFYEARHFASGQGLKTQEILEDGTVVPVGSDLIFCCKTMPKLKIGVEICEDLWVPQPPSIGHALAGATVIVNLSASNEVTGKADYRRDLVVGQSARLLCGYIYASAGEGESTQDVVYSGHNMIAENGRMVREACRFANEPVFGELDVEKMEAERRRRTVFPAGEDHREILFSLQVEETCLTNPIDPAPFVPGDMKERARRCEEILNIQAMGLKKRLEHTNSSCAVVGVSGGLDSTLALLVTLRAFDLLKRDPAGIIAVTMPGFGTTDRTYDNALNLVKCLHATLLEVDIKEAVKVHFKDIGQDLSVQDVTYENSQARERTQILMDIANKRGGMVIGTGDLSELVLGWATYNGDHMSMYGVNASVPKTLVRHLVQYYADSCGRETLRRTLLDVLDTPVSPELLPPKEGKISQKTEDIVGPYELHDFYLYYVLRYGFSPAKVYRLARLAFQDIYEKDVILKWLKMFYRRFFSQQFKRSCLPDGPKVGSVAVSPRGDLRMPSDSVCTIWLEEIAHL